MPEPSLSQNPSRVLKRDRTGKRDISNDFTQPKPIEGTETSMSPARRTLVLAFTQPKPIEGTETSFDYDLRRVAALHSAKTHRGY